MGGITAADTEGKREKCSELKLVEETETMKVTDGGEQTKRDNRGKRGSGCFSGEG